MHSKYKIVIIISFLLIILSFTISTINYFVSLNNAQKQLRTQSLPLSLNNIYSDIQKHIIEPYLVSSMMANDTFVQDWLSHDEQNSQKIQKYLEVIKNKYNMFNAFLVSDKTKNYYTQNGFIETISEEKADNKWYFTFKNIQNKHEINLDFNASLSNSMMMFINYKIINNKYEFLGATGVALKISYINDMLKHFRVNHNFTVTFFNEKGEIVLAEKEILKQKSLNEIKELRAYKDLILSKETHLVEYKKDGVIHMLNSKYIPELELYLTVDANLKDFTEDVKSMFYFNIFISLAITIIISLIVYFVIKSYSGRLEYLSHYDSLTEISNRRDFEEKLKKQLLLLKRDKQQRELSVIFMDVDNFKDINDSKGHAMGDRVLKRVAQIFKNTLRETDLIARWGGEEFIISLLDSSLEDSVEVAEKLRYILESDLELKELLGSNITGSFGVTMYKQTDSMEQLISRADEAMYISKNNGKNQVHIQ